MFTTQHFLRSYWLYITNYDIVAKNAIVYHKELINHMKLIRVTKASYN